MKSRTIVAVLALSALSPLPAISQQSSPEMAAAEARPEVLVLGTYHMASSGSHVVGSDTDDVLSPKRQSEIAELIAVLREFRPTKIAVEMAFHDDDVLQSRYNDYLVGESDLTPNERQQVGFRLAKELGHATVYAVDADGEYPFPRVQDYAEARGHEEEFQSWLAEANARGEKWNSYLAAHTILEALLYMNSDEYAAESLASDYRLAHLGEPWNWAGPDLVSDWFRRNMRIYSNILDLIESPNERVLVIFGAGHLGWLWHNIDHDPEVRLRKLAEFNR